MQRILVFGLGQEYGGVEQYIYDRLKSLHNSPKILDFVCSFPKPKYFKKFEELGCDYYQISSLKNPIQYFFDIMKLIKGLKYSAVYCNVSFFNGLLLLAVKAGGAKKIIFHSHNSGIGYRQLWKRAICYFCHIFGRLLLSNLLTTKIGCSQLAYKWLFGNEIINKKSIQYNAIDLKKYAFNASKREVLRKKLGVDDSIFLLGNVGRLSYQKNQEYLIDIFEHIHNKDKNTQLIIVGEGEDELKLKEKVKNKHLENEIKFLGFRNDVSDLFQAMDALILPSLFEGLGIVGIEAQAAGLACFFSDTCTTELNIINSKFISLNSSFDYWADTILSTKNMPRKNTTKELSEAGYDLDIAAKQWQKVIF